MLAGDQWDSVFLLAGDDLSVHMYREFHISEVSKMNWGQGGGISFTVEGDWGLIHGGGSHSRGGDSFKGEGEGGVSFMG